MATYHASPRELRARGYRMREVLAMVEYMPKGTPVWGQVHETLACIVDAIQENSYALLSVNTDKRHRNRISRPEPFPRPGAPRKPGGERHVWKSTRAFDSIAEFDAWRASRLQR